MKLKRITTKEGEVYFVDAKTGRRVDADSEHTNPNSSEFTNRFRTLLGLGQFVTVVGWIIFTAAIIAVIVGIASISSNEITGMVAIVAGVISLINGILVVAIGELISCFVSIENNTFETTTLLKSIQAAAK